MRRFRRAREHADRGPIRALHPDRPARRFRKFECCQQFREACDESGGQRRGIVCRNENRQQRPRADREDERLPVHEEDVHVPITEQGGRSGCVLGRRPAQAPEQLPRAPENDHRSPEISRPGQQVATFPSFVASKRRLRNADGIRDPNVPELSFGAEFVHSRSAHSEETGSLPDRKKPLPHALFAANRL